MQRPRKRRARADTEGARALAHQAPACDPQECRSLPRCRRVRGRPAGRQSAAHVRPDRGSAARRHLQLRETAHVFGAITLDTAKFTFRFASVFNGTTIFEFLWQLVQRHDGRKMFLIINNVPCHRQALAAPESPSHRIPSPVGLLAGVHGDGRRAEDFEAGTTLGNLCAEVVDIEALATRRRDSRRSAPRADDRSSARGVRSDSVVRCEDLGTGELVAPLRERTGRRAHRADGGGPAAGRARRVGSRRTDTAAPVRPFVSGTADASSRSCRNCSRLPLNG